MNKEHNPLDRETLLKKKGGQLEIVREHEDALAGLEATGVRAAYVMACWYLPTTAG